MPCGDAAKIRSHACRLVDCRRSEGETIVTLRVGGIRDGCELDYRDAVIDICQVLETSKFLTEASVEFLSKTGPHQGTSTIYRFRTL